MVVNLSLSNDLRQAMYTVIKQSNSMKQTEHLELLLHFSHVQQKLETLSLFSLILLLAFFFYTCQDKACDSCIVHFSTCTNIVFFYDIASL